VLGNGPITFQSATETDTSSGKSSSFGVSLGVSASVGLDKGKLNTGVPSVNFGVSGSKGSFAGTDITNREATLSAGGTATIGTPGSLTLDGATLSAKRVEVDAGSLTIASRQDTSTFASKDKSAGVNVSVTFAGQVSASGNLSTGKQSGDFASVQEQAGIRAGDGGFGIRVAGATDLKGAVIASTAEATRNQLTTGTLTETDLQNRETFKATSTSIGAGIGANLGKDRQGTINTDQSGNKLSGIKTGIGTLSATPPAALSASGSQSSTTLSAIATGGITVTSGDTASLGVAQSISRDTSAASADAAALLRQPADSALTKQFTDAKRGNVL
jgi:filamentous hemagglutinin